MKYVALIPLRGGSKSIALKNICLLAGKPLCAWVIEAACGCKEIDEVWISTDSKEIADVVKGLKLPVKLLERPAEFATDEATTESVMLHFIENVNVDVLLTIQATSPVLTSQNLTEAIQLYQLSSADSLVAAVRTKRFFWSENAVPLNYNPLKRPRRQDWEGTLMENGAFYMTSKALLEEQGCRLGGNICVYEMRQRGAEIEIDEPGDWQALEWLISQEIQDS